MARITVEDCIDKLPSRFELVLVASNRARKLHSGESPTVEKNNDKNTVIALREIADETIPIEEMKKNLVEDYQTVSLSDEEDELSLENSMDEEENSIEKENDNNNIDEENQSLVHNEESEADHSNEINTTINQSNAESEILK